MRQPGAGTKEISARAAALLIAGLLALALLGVFGCQGARRESNGVAKGAGGSVKLLITRDFGSRVVLKKTVKVTGTPSVLDVLSKNAKVETAYGGGFVNSINGLVSGYTGGGGSKYDWLYYVNGIQSPVGAAEQRVRDGDSVWWDYHNWSFVSSNPAVVGAYPEPFLHGYDGKIVPVAVVYADGFAHEAGAVRDSLLKLGVKNVTFEALRPGLVRPSSRSLILIGAWKQLSGLDWVADAAANPGTSGVYVRFAPGAIRAYYGAGKLSDPQRNAGAVLATGEAGQPAVAWLVTGTDEASVQRAAGLMTKEPNDLRGIFGVVIGPGGIPIPVPSSGL